MKKYLFILCASALALVSCNKELTPADQEISDPAQIVFNISAIHPDGAATKAVKTGWETGDVVFVFFSGQTAPAYLEMKWTGTDWEFAEKNSLSLASDETGTMTAVYLPFGSDATVAASEGAYQFSETYYSYYLTDQQSYTVTEGEIDGTFAMSVPEGYVQFFLDDADAGTAEIELREPHLTPQGIASIAADGTISHTTVAHGAPLPGYAYDKEDKLNGESKGWLFSGILAEETRNVETDYYFTLVKGGWNGSYSGKAFDGKTLYRGAQEGRALKLPLNDWTEMENCKPIDLGFDFTSDGVTKRVYWSSCNVGATCDYPTDTDEFAAARGITIQWGETEPNEHPGDWRYYKWMKEGYDSWKGISKYTMADGQYDGSWYDENKTFKGDGKSVLEPEDDAARANEGGLWRTPTYEEFQALLNYYPFPDVFTWEFVNYGWKVTNESYDDGRFVFFPLQGRYSSSYNYFWSATLKDTMAPYYFRIGYEDKGISQNNRAQTFAVRPVSD